VKTLRGRTIKAHTSKSRKKIVGGTQPGFNFLDFWEQSIAATGNQAEFHTAPIEKEKNTIKISVTKVTKISHKNPC